MSNDLISRNALLEGVNYYYTHTPNDSPEHYAYGVVLKEIREHPAAFDKEKVIDELKNLKDKLIDCKDLCLECLEIECDQCALKKALEIVKKGGIE